MTEIPSPESLGTPEVSFDDVVNYVRAKIDEWVFDDESNIATTHLFTLNVTHWLLETFGQKGDDGSFAVYPYSDSRSDVTGEFANEKLPPSLRELFYTIFQDELQVMGSSSIRMETAHDHIKNDSSDSVTRKLMKKGYTFQQMIKYFTENPVEHVEEIARSIETVVPRVKLVFRAYAWGLVFMIDHNGVQVAPFGSEESTWTPTRYVLGLKNDGELASAVCDLAILGATNSWSDFNMQNLKVPVARLKELESRLSGESEIPLI